MSDFAKGLLNWFDGFGRKNLPWQKNITPYRVWISEIMLQQTQVATVIPYFEKFIAHFPDIQTLAKSELDTVLHFWTGLGYYARARNIYKSANIIVDHFAAEFPSDLDTLISLPGIGRSTAGAILSIAFQKATPILDGNVKRVLTRLHAISGYPGEKSVEDKLWKLASGYTPEKRCADFTQAIMDLGATICTRAQPNCNACPLQFDCLSYQEGSISLYPQPKAKTKLPVKNTQFLILWNEKGQLLLEKRPPMGIWGGLWGFPDYPQSDFAEHCRLKYGAEVITYSTGQLFRHTFSHYHLDITPVFIDIAHHRKDVMEGDLIWCLANEIPQVGLAAPVKKLLLEFAKTTY
ncbi:MAG: A/G-specific adenine glycosylase [Gammaproteobacteria bacterium]|nr:A/G-specific adenine glycosylase [Gammaproteobacteria bacterium]